MSTPPVLAKATGTCKDYEPQCVGNTQKILFYTALGLIAVGISGHIVSLVALFVDNQAVRVSISANRLMTRNNSLMKMAESKQSQEKTRKQKIRALKTRLLGLQFQPVEALLSVTVDSKRGVFRTCLIVLLPPIVLFFVAYISSWSVRVGVPAIFTLVATLCFLESFTSCKDIQPNGHPATNVFRVILAAILKMFISPPASPKLLYENQTTEEDDYEKLLHTPGFRFLDNAAVEEGPETRRWILCTVTEVEQTKLIIHMFPIWITLILCGLVSAIGSTYFTEQAKNMNYMVGKLKVTDTVIMILYEIGKGFYSRIYKVIQKNCGYKWTPRIGIGLATIFGTLCCIISAVVETQRIHVIRAHGLIEKPNDTIPMTVFWLLPQYLLLSGLDSFYEDSVTDFLCDLSPPPMQKFLVFLNPALSGIGFIANILFVRVVGRLSQRHGKQNWFQHDLNGSRLDRYYWTLAAISAVNFIWFLLCAYLYPYRETTESNYDEEAGNETVESVVVPGHEEIIKPSDTQDLKEIEVINMVP